MTTPNYPAVRIDYEPNDSTAPEPTSRVPGASVVVVEDDRILMIKRSDSGNWALPGGGHDIGESLPETAIRECMEETGITVELTGVVGTFTDPQRVFEYRSARPEVRQEFSVMFTARPIAGNLTPSAESVEVRWIPTSDLQDLATTSATQLRIAAWLEYHRSGKIHLG